MREHGFNESHPSRAPTCSSNRKVKTVDCILVRGAIAVEPLAPVPVGDSDLTPLPSGEEPSDHVPLLARITLG